MGQKNYQKPIRPTRFKSEVKRPGKSRCDGGSCCLGGLLVAGVDREIGVRGVVLAGFVPESSSQRMVKLTNTCPDSSQRMVKLTKLIDELACSEVNAQ